MELMCRILNKQNISTLTLVWLKKISVSRQVWNKYEIIKYAWTSSSSGYVYSSRTPEIILSIWWGSCGLFLLLSVAYLFQMVVPWHHCLDVCSFDCACVWIGALNLNSCKRHPLSERLGTLQDIFEVYS